MTAIAAELLQALQLLAALQESSSKNDRIAYHGFALKRAQEEVTKSLFKYAPHPFVHWRLCRPPVTHDEGAK
jgi:hypothetical protein